MSHDTSPDDPGTDAGAQSDDDRGLPKVTRRMALGLLGLGVLAGGESTAVQGDVGGGPDSDELAHVLRPTYEGAESELPAPGVEGGRFTVTDTGGTYPQWSELRDTGSAWEPISFGAGSVNTENPVTAPGLLLPNGDGTDQVQSERKEGISISANGTVTITFSDIFLTETTASLILFQAGEAQRRAIALYLVSNFGSSDNSSEILEIASAGGNFDINNPATPSTDFVIDVTETSGVDRTLETSLIHMTTEHR